jgi:RNA polymerase sigma factor (sigma-70 family)
MEVSSLPRPGGGILPRSRRLLATLGDDRLVEQLRSGNEVAFEVVYDRHHRGILSFCRHMLSSQEEAEDALQHTFISAHGDLLASDKEIRLKPWLYTIARNRCLSMLRARREQAAELDDIPTAGFTEQVQRRDELRELLSDMRELPADQRAALVLSELGDLSHGEIAEIVGCETLKVKSLVFQARSSLIESRSAREIPCEEIREQLATLSGGALRRGPLRRHVRSCAGCAEFRDQVKRQRQMMAAVLPVVPSAALKASVLGAVGLGPAAAGGLTVAGAGAGAAGAGAGGMGAAASGGGLLSAAGASGAAKLAVAAAIAAGTIGGGVALERAVVSHNEASDNPVVASDSSSPGSQFGAGAAPGAAAAAVAATGRRHADLARDGLAGGTDSPRAAAHRRHGVRRGSAATGSGAKHGSGTPASGSAGHGSRAHGGSRHGASHEHGRHSGSSRSSASHRHARGHRHDAPAKPPKTHPTHPATPTAEPPPPPPPPDEQGNGNGSGNGNHGKDEPHLSSRPAPDPLG